MQCIWFRVTFITLICMIVNKKQQNDDNSLFMIAYITPVLLLRSYGTLYAWNLMGVVQSRLCITSKLAKLIAPYQIKLPWKWSSSTDEGRILVHRTVCQRQGNPLLAKKGGYPTLFQGALNALAHGICDSNFKIVISEYMLRIKFMITFLWNCSQMSTTDHLWW